MRSGKTSNPAPQYSRRTEIPREKKPLSTHNQRPGLYHAKVRLGKLTERERSRCIEEGRCFRCRETGHISIDCRKFKFNHVNGFDSESNDENKTDEEYIAFPHSPNTPVQGAISNADKERASAQPFVKSNPEEPAITDTDNEHQLNNIMLAVAETDMPSRDNGELNQISQHYQQHKRKNQNRLLYLTGLLNRTTKARCLIDCGATHNFIAKHKVPSEVPIEIIHQTVRVANGQEIQTEGKVNLDLWVKGCHFRVSAWVFATTQFDMVLGQPWLTEYNPKIDWKFCTVQWKNNLLSTSQGSTLIKGTSVQLASIRDICRAVCNSEGHLFAVHCRETPDSKTGEPPEVIKWREEFPEVFSVKHGLPPKRCIEHEINTGQAAPEAEFIKV
jgi:hypothetical protein